MEVRDPRLFEANQGRGGGGVAVLVRLGSAALSLAIDRDRLPGKTAALHAARNRLLHSLPRAHRCVDMSRRLLLEHSTTGATKAPTRALPPIRKPRHRYDFTPRGFRRGT